MAIYEVPWSMYGTARVEADGVEEAEQVAMDGCMAWSGDMDWERNDVDGCEVLDAEEV